ncbi:rhomboid family intramembrane serine protease, partial [Enterococcus faecalis]|uniref:rhomboid family intramembrane serine protease n=1 Tax=Enterococcus faecalis TaxID=1351 RepID=UPI003CC61AB5
ILGRHFRDNPAIMYKVQRYSMFIVIKLLFNLFSSSVDMMGHVGGLIGGLLVATALAVPNREEAFNKHERILATLIFIFLVV